MACINSRFAVVTQEEFLQTLTFLECVVCHPSLFMLIQLFSSISVNSGFWNIYLFIYIYLFICLFVYLFICLFVSLFVCLFPYLFICLFIYLFTDLVHSTWYVKQKDTSSLQCLST